MPRELIAIAGPTGVGKSAVALQLARELDGEIISVDSMQVYRGMDIGTAKPSPGERRLVPHHLIDILEITETFDAAQFVRLAQEAIEGLRDRGRVPILCGGTGLYFKALFYGLGEAPPADPKVRALLEKIPRDELLGELERSDPETFRKIDRANPRRVIRALEVIRLTGKPFSGQRASWTESAPVENGLFLVLTRHADDLHRRIEARVDQMFREGLVGETKRLLDAGLEENAVAMQALGYRQVVEHLQGELSLPDTIELVKTRTRQFAKRQLTWFRRQQSAKWIEVPVNEMPDETAERIRALV